jgi:hypothetical protein
MSLLPAAEFAQALSNVGAVVHYVVDNSFLNTVGQKKTPTTIYHFMHSVASVIQDSICDNKLLMNEIIFITPKYSKVLRQLVIDVALECQAFEAKHPTRSFVLKITFNGLSFMPASRYTTTFTTIIENDKDDFAYLLYRIP